MLDLADVAARYNHRHRGFLGNAGNRIGIAEFYHGDNGSGIRVTTGFIHIVEILVGGVGHILQQHVLGALPVGQVDGVHQLGEQGWNLANGAQFQAFGAGLLEITGKEQPPVRQVTLLKLVVVTVEILNAILHEGVAHQHLLEVGRRRVGHLEAAHQVVPFLADLGIGVGEVALVVGNVVPLFLEDMLIYRDFLHLQLFGSHLIHFIVSFVIAGGVEMQAQGTEKHQAQGAPWRFCECCHDLTALVVVVD